MAGQSFQRLYARLSHISQRFLYLLLFYSFHEILCLIYFIFDLIHEILNFIYLNFDNYFFYFYYCYYYFHLLGNLEYFLAYLHYFNYYCQCCLFTRFHFHFRYLFMNADYLAAHLNCLVLLMWNLF